MTELSLPIRRNAFGDGSAASFGAARLAEPLNPPVSEARLKPLPVLDRPGLAASA